MDRIKDYRVTIKVRNARILKALSDMGESVGQIAANNMGVSYVKLLALSNLKLSPIDKDGNIIPEVYKLCEYTNKTPLDLFSPDQVAPLETNTAEVDMTAEEVETLMLPASGGTDPSRLLENAQSLRALQTVMETLTPRETKVLNLRFGIGCDEHTYEDAGKVFGVSKERVRQIEAKAIRKLRHPFNADKLVAATHYLPDPEEEDK